MLTRSYKQEKDKQMTKTANILYQSIYLYKENVFLLSQMFDKTKMTKKRSQSRSAEKAKHCKYI